MTDIKNASDNARERKSQRQTFEVRKGGNKNSQFEIENPPTVATTDNPKVSTHVKEKRSHTGKDRIDV